MNLNKRVNELYNEIVQYRRHLHQYPELSKKEFKTQAYIVSVLEKHNISYELGATTGVVAYIGEGPICIGARGDIDALPIEEMNDIPYKSKNNNVMHACGHDVHTAILLGVSILLKEIEPSLKGKIKLFFQPNEEVSSGAIDFIKEGFMNNPKVDYMLGMHVMPYLEVGEIEVKNDVLTGSSEYVEINVFGKSGHAAYPETGIDAIVIASDIILKLQTIVSRNVSPLDSVALSLGMITGGTKPNIIADYIKIKGTLRTLSLETKNLVKKRINEICRYTALAYNGDCKVTYEEGYRPLINNNEVNDIIIKNATSMNTIKKINYKTHPSLGVEDFGYYLEHSKGAYFHIGCGNQSLNYTEGLHTSKFMVDENCMKQGIELQVRNILSLLNREDILED